MSFVFSSWEVCSNVLFLDHVLSLELSNLNSFICTNCKIKIHQTTQIACAFAECALCHKHNCVYMCVRTHMLDHVSTFTGRDWHQVSSSIAVHHSFDAGSLTEMGTCLFLWTDWPEGPRNLPVLSAGVTDECHHNWLLTGEYWLECKSPCLHSPWAISPPPALQHSLTTFQISTQFLFM